MPRAIRQPDLLIWFLQAGTVWLAAFNQGADIQVENIKAFAPTTGGSVVLTTPARAFLNGAITVNATADSCNGGGVFISTGSRRPMALSSPS